MKNGLIRIRLWYEKASARVVTLFAKRFLVWRDNNQTRLATLFPTRRTEIFLSALPLALGIVSFFIVVGPRVLNPMNIAWLEAAGDPATHYLGWLFFRDSPWTFPIGLNPRYGLELSSSVLYSDSNVLLALLFKPFSSLLPTPFQYFGIWLLVCFCLQAWFSWKLIGLISDNVVIRLLGSGLFIFSPPMITRNHYAINLSSHFLIIAALYISFNPKISRRRLSWGILLTVSAMVHPYLLVMTVLVWIADLSRRALKEDVLTWSVAITELAILLIIVGIICWQSGYFSIDDGGSIGGFGYYRMNLLSILDSNGWSYLLKDIAAAEDGEYVGFNYLGSGVLFLLISAIPILIDSWSQFIHTVKKYLYLFILLLCLSVYAVSNNIGFGPLDFAYYYLPDSVLKVFGIVRASGRIFWPVFYTIIFSIVFLVVQMHKKRAIIFLTLAFIIQVVDTSAGWREVRKGLMVDQSRVWSTSFIDPFWKEAAEKYKKVRHILPNNLVEGWQSLAVYAGINGLGSDAVYLARVDNMAVTDAQQKASSILRSGDFEQDSLYILADNLLRRAAISVDKDSTLLAKIDGLNVVAPGWKSCMECSHIENEITLSDFLTPLKYGERFLFGHKDSGVYFLDDGWSYPEDWGTWSNGSSATMSLPIPPQQVDSILIESNAFVSPSHDVIANQRLTVSINGIPAADLVLSEPSPSITEPATVFEIKMPEAVKQKSGDEYFELLFNFPDATSPKDVGLSQDTRELALGLVALTVR